VRTIAEPPSVTVPSQGLPAGGAVAMGVSWAMLSSWGISTAEYVLYRNRIT
jgi:hypothetical protein